MKPIILFRENKQLEEESNVAKQYFDYTNSRVMIPNDSLVIGRYSCLPYYDELQRDIEHLNSQLINSLYEHKYIADFTYYYDIEEMTFPTYFNFVDIPYSKREQAFVVKGKTNSIKNKWNEKMFAPNFKKVVEIGTELMSDSLIGSQGIVIREYIPLETFEIGINDMPITNEWRIFFYKGEVVDFGYYWGSTLDNQSLALNAYDDFVKNGLEFAKIAANNIKEFTNFFVIDVAKTQKGNWLIVELNDGQQSGLNNSLDSNSIYKNLKNLIEQDLKNQEKKKFKF